MKSARLLLASVSLACLLPLASMAQTPPAAAPAPAKPAPVAAAPVAAPAPAANAPLTRADFPALLKETLTKNPEIVMDAIKAAQEKQRVESEASAKDALMKHKDELLNDANAPSAGASMKDADVTLVEFFDYHCGYCKHMVEPITQLIKEDKKLRVVFKDFPILSADSATAARAALAVNKIDKTKYFPFYVELMKFNGKFDDKALAGIAKTVGVDAAKMKAEMDKKETGDQLDANTKLGQMLDIHGTPALILGDQMLPGAVPYEDLKKMVEAVRAAKK